jgi:hypothetical protein
MAAALFGYFQVFCRPSLIDPIVLFSSSAKFSRANQANLRVIAQASVKI